MELAMNVKLLATMGLIGAMGVVVAEPSIAAWPGAAIPVSQAAADEINSNEAVAHVGEWTNLQGTVSEILTNRGAATIINVGGHYPDLTFKAVLFPDQLSSPGKVQEFDRRIVIISGTIKLVRGHPEIVVTSRDQIAL
jgi:hypothetical protein